MDPMKVGVIGCGNISNIYFQAGKRFEAIEIVACADLVPEKAVAKAEEHGVPKVCSVEELLADDAIDIVLNITIPKAHAGVALRALEAGKHVYNEKPLTLTREEGRSLLDLAGERGLRVGCAPDTVLGAGIQTARKLIDDGWIGEPVSATAFMQCHGHESWHPDPEFYYETGGGPMFDMGPYYLTALVTLMGPVAAVSASTRVTFPERVITSAPKRGKRVPVEVPTHISGVMDFRNGAVGTIVTSFDVWRGSLPCIEIHGTEGSMSVPDPNSFGGPVKVFRPGYEDWREVPHSHIHAENARGLGVADLACAVRAGRPHRANGELAYHVLDLMHAFHDAADQGARVALASACERPAPMPMNVRDGEVGD
ncbi:MAG: Gfo/Idh/MocA family oxidoreductase [Candidatus Hydrogenedens sp.]|nr:Gfo/Idh/MocA family oxidoreductase [Candidatus Hydrogenedentota bacterium]NLF58917.1 Gfo/Idh/MocA family oxidoreductase [Candidatus Hydrogenedens sp.]